MLQEFTRSTTHTPRHSENQNQAQLQRLHLVMFVCLLLYMFWEYIIQVPWGLFYYCGISYIYIIYIKI